MTVAPATQFGTYAAKLVEHEKYGVTVAMRNNHVTENPLDEIAGKSRLVPDGHAMWRLPAAWAFLWAKGSTARLLRRR